jgi:hypothetical protein
MSKSALPINKPVGTHLIIGNKIAPVIENNGVTFRAACSVDLPLGRFPLKGTIADYFAEVGDQSESPATKPCNIRDVLIVTSAIKTLPSGRQHRILEAQLL